MRILFDHGTPAPLIPFLKGHTVTKAKDAGWDRLGRTRRFDILLTPDKNIRYQQNLAGRRIALVVLSTPQWPRLQLHTEKVLAAINFATPGSYIEVNIPHTA